MSTNINNILREKITLINLYKRNTVYKILKSIKQNNNIHNNIKIYSNFILERKNNKQATLSKKHKICILTGKRSGVLKGFDFSRYKVKGLVLDNRYTNIKKNNF